MPSISDAFHLLVLTGSVAHALGGGSLVIWNDHNGAWGMPHALLANRAEQHSGKGSPTAATHDQQVRVPRRLQEHWCLVARYDLGSNLDLLVTAEGVKNGLFEGFAGAGRWIGDRTACRARETPMP